MSRLGLGTGSNEVKGVEGKIKGGSAPLGLTPCLHIFLGGDSWKIGGVPFFDLYFCRVKGRLSW